MTTHLIDHLYTLAEIGRMRAAILAVDECDTVPGWARDSMVNKPRLSVSEVEELLRTYMMAGIRPGELEAKARDAEARHWRHFPPDNP